ncbi:MAG: Do family serine endopeptidase [Thermodesulfobacteriota bacterium]
MKTKRVKKIGLLKILVAFATGIFILFHLHPSESASLTDRETPVVRAVSKVGPAVVNISSEQEIRKQVNPFSGFSMDPFFDSFFKDFFDPGFERRHKRASLGSGVIIDGKRGFILTNAHVIDKTGTITVILQDEREFKAKIVGADPDTDLAVLKIESKDLLPAVGMGNSDDVMIGETVIAIGNPFGFSHTVTTGVVSALNRSLRSEDRVFLGFIQTDASINPGNSGGPLLNINGELIGINTAIYAKAQGIGFAIPINKAKRIVGDLIRYGEVVQSWIGIVVQGIDSQTATYLNAPDPKGVLVKEVEPGSPAAKSGIQTGDLLISLGNQKILSPEDYEALEKNIGVGETFPVRIRREGKEKIFSLTSESFPSEMALQLTHRLLGVAVENLNKRNRSAYRIFAENGVVITEIERSSYLARIGARPGDVIRQINEITIRNLDEFKKAVIRYRLKKSAVLLLQREDQGYYITVRL